MFVEGMLAGTRRVVGDNGRGAFGGNRLAPRIGVVGGVGYDEVGGQAPDQGVGLRAVAALAAGQGEPYGRPQATHGQVDLGAQAATGAAKGLIFRPPFLAPAAC